MTTRRTVGPLHVGLALGALCWAACGEDPAPKAAAPAVKKAAAAAPKDAPAEATTRILYEYAYNPLGKRDPFRPYVEQQRAGDGDRSPCNEPLCQWDLDQLNLVAVVSGDANPLAMLEDPQKTGHIVRRETRVGKQGGKVTQILRDCLVVTEYWNGPDGKRNPNPVKVCVKTEQAKASMVDLFNPAKTY